MAAGHTLVDVLVDMDEPGSKWARPSFQRALEMVEANEVDGIVVARLDRFSRSVADTAKALQRIEAAGGVDVFPQLAVRKNAKDRIVSPDEVIAARPDVIVGSWCGKKFVPVKVTARPGCADVPAVATGWWREIKSTLILQPGPAALTDGLDHMARIVSEWAERRATAS